VADQENRDLARTAALSAWAFITLVLLFSVVFLMREMIRQGQKPLGIDSASTAVVDATTPPGAQQMRDIALYFPSRRPFQLDEESYRIQYDTTAANCRAALEALIQGPRQEGNPVLSPTLHVRGVYLTSEGDLIVDFSRELEAGTQQSVANESLMLQSLLKTLFQTALRGTDNLAVVRIQILMEGLPLGDQFPKHVDMSEPFAAELFMTTKTGVPNV
jgi:hypothetical protein